MPTLKVNGSTHDVKLADDTPLLWVLRDVLDLTGTKFGCGEGLCGACTVHVDGQAMKSCKVTVAQAAGTTITTIEGLGGAQLHPVQRAWLEENVSQCGYCQTGQIMCAAALLKEKRKPSDKDIDEAMAGNLCRCGTYPRVRKAIKRAGEMMP